MSSRVAEAVQQIKKSQLALEASPILGFSRWKFFLGVSKSYLTLFIIGRFPGLYWQWHALQLAILLPIQIFRWHFKKMLACLIEFCWVANMFIVAYLFALHLQPTLFDAYERGIVYRMIFAFGVGPLGGSVLLLNNALVPHSIDHTASLLIHLSPSLTAYGLRWAEAKDPLFPHAVVSFEEYCTPPLTFLFTWAAAHTAFMALFGRRLHAAGQKTTYTYNLQGKSLFTKVLGEIGDGKMYEPLRFVLYELISVGLNAAVLAATYPLFAHGTERLHFAMVVGTCIVSTWNGTVWYANRFARLASAVATLENLGPLELGKPPKKSFFQEGEKVFSDVIAGLTPTKSATKMNLLSEAK